MKTVFISILSGVEAKNILRTNILSTLLRREDVRIILFLRCAERVGFYKKDFGHPRIVYETISAYHSTLADRIIEFLRHYLLRTKTLFLYKRLVYEDTGRRSAYIGSLIMSYFLGWRMVRYIVRWIDFSFINDRTFMPYFDRYRPDAVFLANIFDGMEISLLRCATRLKVSTIGFINSWDKITSKGFVRLLPDHLVVPNLFVRDEALQFLDIAVDRIDVVGVPQYDSYISEEGVFSREVFFRKIGSDPSQKLIVFSPMGSSLSDSDWDMIDFLYEIITHRIKNNAALLVRFQPNDFFSQEELEKRPWLRYDLPGIRFSTERGMDWDMTSEELLHLKNTLFHASLLVSYASSIVIDAAFFDKPVININFEVKSGQPALRSPTRRYHTEHYRKALRSGGIKLVNSPNELTYWIDRYLDQPWLDQEGRRRLVEEQCWSRDGRAGERIASCILNTAISKSI